MSLYEELGVGPDATDDEIKAAHRRRVKETHPDAGGSRKAFDRVQHAYGILSDGRKRARYDQTGVEGAAATDAALESQAMSVVAGKMMSCVQGDFDPRYGDLVRAIVTSIAEDREQAKATIAECEAQIARLEQFARRLKRKGDGEDKLSPMIVAQIGAFRNRIEQVRDALAMFDRAIQLAGEYVYGADKPPPQQAAPTEWVRMGIGSFGTSATF